MRILNKLVRNQDLFVMTSGFYGSESSPGVSQEVRTPSGIRFSGVWPINNRELKISPGQSTGMALNTFQCSENSVQCSDVFAQEEVFARSVQTVFRSEHDLAPSKLRALFSEHRAGFRANPVAT